MHLRKDLTSKQTTKALWFVIELVSFGVVTGALLMAWILL